MGVEGSDQGLEAANQWFVDTERLYRAFRAADTDDDAGVVRVTALEPDWPSRGLSCDRDTTWAGLEALARRMCRPRVAWISCGALSAIRVTDDHPDAGPTTVVGLPYHDPVFAPGAPHHNPSHTTAWGVALDAVDAIRAGIRPPVGHLPESSKSKRVKRLKNEMRVKLQSRLSVLDDDYAHLAGAAGGMPPVLTVRSP